MLKFILGIDNWDDIAAIENRGGWVLALVLIAIAIAVSIFLYRSESRLSQRRRVLMGVCQGLALLMLIVIILKPVAVIRQTKPYKRTILVLLDTSRSMLTEDTRSTAEEVARAAKALGKLPLEKSLTNDEVDDVRQEVGPVSRIDLARAMLEHPEIKLLENLNKDYQVRFFTFDDQVRPEGGAENPTEWLESRAADGETTQVGEAMTEAVARYPGQEIAGVVVFSDFASLKGQDPVEAARNLEEQGIPVFPIPIGLPAPPDIQVQRVIAPEVVFKGDHVPLRVQFKSSGFKGSSIELSLTIDSELSSSQQIELKGGVQFADFMFTPKSDSTGSVELNLAIPALAAETSVENNSLARKVRIIDEKIKVLYIEGMPRWEYRYLRWVLMRDPRIDVRFLMTQGDPALAAGSNQHLSGFPEDVKDAFKFDLIILGDVPASYFNATQLSLIDDLVKKSGGSLLMVAGPMAAPVSYRDTPIETMLPVNLGTGQWESLDSDVYPRVAKGGRESPVSMLSLSGDVDENDRIWSRVRPLYAVPQLGGAKSGATVLMTLPKSDEQLPDYPLVSWQRYGNGKSLFVATEELWRMRREVGRKFHERFWGQTIQFLTLSRLLGQNKQISVDTEDDTYSAGEPVKLYANVLDESFEPDPRESYTVVIEQKGAPETQAQVKLMPVPNSLGMFSGEYLADEDGTYVVRTEDTDAEISNQAEFDVATLPMEDRVKEMRADVVRQIAELSGGKNLTLSELKTFPASELGEAEELSTPVQMEKELWDIWPLFVLLVAFSGTEWYFRRRDNLV
jgi:uncharacterized membrane protein